MTVENTPQKGRDIDLLDVNLFVERHEHEVFRQLRDEAPVHFNPEPDGPGFYALTRYDHIKAVAQDHVRFCSGKGTQIRDKRAEGTGHPSVHNADPPIHGALRKVGMPPLRRSVIEGRGARIRGIITDLMEATPRGDYFDFVEAISVKIPMIVFADVLGVPDDMQLTMVHWANTMSDVLASDAEQATARADLFAYFRRLAAEKRADPQEDLASALVTAEIDGARLTEEQLDAYFMVLTVAGNETTRNLLSGGLEQLCRQPRDMARLREAPGLIPKAVEEMVRWVSPVIQMRRTAIEDSDLFGVPIAAGTKVVLYFASGNRDERMFDRAGDFIIDRQPNAHMGFGIGPHFCLGAHLARVETQIFFEEFFKRYSACEIEGLGDRLPSNWFAGTAKLMVKWQ